jgi:hypothetical protein
MLALVIIGLIRVSRSDIFSSATRVAQTKKPRAAVRIAAQRAPFASPILGLAWLNSRFRTLFKITQQIRTGTKIHQAQDHDIEGSSHKLGSEIAVHRTDRYAYAKGPKDKAALWMTPMWIGAPGPFESGAITLTYDNSHNRGGDEERDNTGDPADQPRAVDCEPRAVGC